MTTRDVLFSTLIFNREVREHIMTSMKKHDYSIEGISGIEGMMDSLKGRENAIIFIDSEAVLAYGAGVISKLKRACQTCRLILLCSQDHRGVVKPVMELGAYGCIIEPYPEWELLTMVRPILMDLKLEKKGKPKARTQGRKP